jgi:hypothetical protein
VYGCGNASVRLPEMPGSFAYFTKEDRSPMRHGRKRKDSMRQRTGEARELQLALGWFEELAKREELILAVRLEVIHVTWRVVGLFGLIHLFGACSWNGPACIGKMFRLGGNGGIMLRAFGRFFDRAFRNVRWLDLRLPYLFALLLAFGFRLLRWGTWRVRRRLTDGVLLGLRLSLPFPLRVHGAWY